MIRKNITNQHNLQSLNITLSIRLLDLHKQQKIICTAYDAMDVKVINYIQQWYWTSNATV